MDTIYVAERLFGAYVYDLWFISPTVRGVHQNISIFEETEWPMDKRLQSYVIKEVSTTTKPTGVEVVVKAGEPL